MTDPLSTWKDGAVKNAILDHVASGGGRDFMRPISQQVYEGVIGSAVALAYTPDRHGGAITRQMAADYLDHATSSGWTVVSIKNDWADVF